MSLLRVTPTVRLILHKTSDQPTSLLVAFADLAGSITERGRHHTGGRLLEPADEV